VRGTHVDVFICILIALSLGIDIFVHIAEPREWPLAPSYVFSGNTIAVDAVDHYGIVSGLQHSPPPPPPYTHTGRRTSSKP